MMADVLPQAARRDQSEKERENRRGARAVSVTSHGCYNRSGQSLSTASRREGKGGVAALPGGEPGGASLFAGSGESDDRRADALGQLVL